MNHKKVLFICIYNARGVIGRSIFNIMAFKQCESESLGIGLDLSGV